MCPPSVCSSLGVHSIPEELIQKASPKLADVLGGFYVFYGLTRGFGPLGLPREDVGNAFERRSGIC
jgi:hypothetical protein